MIKKLLISLLVCGLAFAVDARPGPDSNYNISVSGGGGGNVNWTFTAGPAIQASPSGGSFTFSSVNIGTAAANRYVVVCAAENTTGPFTAVTIGGISATKAADGFSGGGGTSIWSANVPTGTTANIVLTNTGTFPGFVGIAVGILSSSTGTASSPATQLAGGFSNDPQVTTSAVTVPTNGVGVDCAVSTATSGTPTWNTGTQDSSVASGTSFQLMMAHLNSTGTPSVSGFAFANFSQAAAAWGP